MLNLKARWVFPVSGEPIRDGVVRIEDDRIVAVEPGRAGQGVRDLGNVAILPGLVNAHTHLELSGIAEPLGWPGISIVEWIGLVVATRRSDGYDVAEAVRCGMSECARAGVAAVGDIVQRPPDGTEDPVAITAFLELIGPTELRAGQALDAAETYVGAGKGRGAFSAGLSPHAPYSVRRELVEGACRVSREHGVPVAFHLAESREEMQLLGEGAGPFRELLERLDAWDPSVQHAGRRPFDFLEMLAAADRALVIHGNYLDEEEIRFVAERRDRMSVIYCPRTHAWFQHEPYPLESMLGLGAPVALGTDSRASSADLNLVEEMRTVAKRHPMVPRDKIVEMGTLAGAKALGRDAELGSLEPGKRGRLAIVDLPESGDDDPYQLLLGE
jgi:cytosine/adenosine deaminase-related metal-dependent hydrolase